MRHILHLASVLSWWITQKFIMVQRSLKYLIDLVCSDLDLDSDHLRTIHLLLILCIRCLYWVSPTILTRPQPHWGGFLEDQTLALSSWWVLSKDTQWWNHMGYVWGLRNYHSGWCRWLLSSCRILLVALVPHHGCTILVASSSWYSTARQ